MRTARAGVLVTVTLAVGSALGGLASPSSAESPVATPDCVHQATITAKAKAVPQPKGWLSYAHGVNRRGLVAGVMWPAEFWRGRVFTYSFKSGRFTNWGIPPQTSSQWSWHDHRTNHEVWGVGGRHIVGGYEADRPDDSEFDPGQVFNLDRRLPVGDAMRRLPLDSRHSSTGYGLYKHWAVGEYTRNGRASRVDLSSPGLKVVDLLQPSVDPGYLSEDNRLAEVVNGVAVGNDLYGEQAFAIDLRTSPGPTIHRFVPAPKDPDASYGAMFTDGRFVTGIAHHSVEPFDHHYWGSDLLADDARMFRLPLAAFETLYPTDVASHYVLGSGFDEPGFIYDLRLGDAGSLIRPVTGDVRMEAVVGVYRHVAIGVSNAAEWLGPRRWLAYDLRACTPRLVDLGPASGFQNLHLATMRGRYLIGANPVRADPDDHLGHHNAMVWKLTVQR